MQWVSSWLFCYFDMQEILLYSGFENTPVKSGMSPALICYVFLGLFVALPYHSEMSSTISLLLILEGANKCCKLYCWHNCCVLHWANLALVSTRTLDAIFFLVDKCLLLCKQVFGLWCHLIVPLAMFRSYHPGSRRTWLTGDCVAFALCKLFWM